MPRSVPKNQLMDFIGADLGASDWLLIDQERIDRFADATGDHQFIHVDPEQAAKTPFGSTIAHGFLTLSLLPVLQPAGAIAPEGTLMAINYGLDKVRFLQPVKVNSRVRARGKITTITDKQGGRFLIATEITVDIDGEDKPALIADTLTLYITA